MRIMSLSLTLEPPREIGLVVPGGAEGQAPDKEFFS